MDWPRAKAYLVGVFLIVDLLLAYDLVRGGGAALRQPAGSPTGSRFLAREGVVLLGKMPASYPRRVRGLLVRSAPVEPAEMARRVLGQGAALSRRSTGEGAIFEKAKERLIFLDGGTVLYENRTLGEANVGPPLDGTGARRAAAGFLAARRWPLPAGAEDLVLPLAGGNYEVTLVSRYGELPVFSSYLSLLVTPSGVQAAEQEWLAPAGSTSESFEVLPPAEALRRVRDWVRSGRDAGRGRMARLVVERVELGFAGARPEGADSWDLRPVWRVLTRGGTAFYVYNPGGEVEAAR